MHIDIHDETILERFKQGEVVFKIIATDNGDKTRQVHIVNDKHTFSQRLWTHKYTPLLFAVDLYTRLAYLYDCLNREYNTPRTERFTFWWRKVHTKEWSKWFTVNDYHENILV